MSTRYPGGFINRSAPVIVGPTNGEGGSAPGVWTLEQASYYTKQGTWPQKIKDKPLFSWGNNGNGQLGQNNVIARSSPVQVGSLTTWSKISCGIDSVSAIKSDGTLWAWGQNNISGQLGLNDKVNRSSPVQVGSLSTWLKVSIGAYVSGAIKSDGTLWTWGYNGQGQLGQNDRVYRSSPVQVGSGTNWSSISAPRIATVATTAAIKTDGTLWTWGGNPFGGLGQNNIIYRSSPVQVGSLTTWLSVSTTYHTAAIQTNGTLWTFGLNSDGQLGQNNRINLSSPTQVGSLTTWSYVACGSSQIFAVKTDGTLWAWGSNNGGQLGLGDITNRSSPVQVGNSSDWSQASASSNLTSAIKSSGTIWAWGSNSAGQLGQNDTTPRSSPVQVGSQTTWYAISSGLNSIVAIQAI